MSNDMLRMRPFGSEEEEPVSLAEIERDADDGLAQPRDVLSLVDEVRRLRRMLEAASTRIP